ncbi:hypothetical protein D1007_48094 [Hordeum vulgare]|uniref:uncharacterized protein LOC123439638 n=1 Tax=Hordeum vulgare subsp. vulgare TaxID=112509 RepID=UPI00162CBE00|nr:uncharacterized protein LOC123439638 [Hordeum vulgare subsp. vulgare]KAE8778937.1 hypothetical protein D1007_48094 [Hordeum vulgare]KAI5005915.1 hypothetical protein ZWY2020_033158 [Hordeum vulgare]
MRRVRPRFGHGGGSLRRFTSSSSPNVPNDKHVGKSGPPSAPPSEPLPPDSTELIGNLHPDTLVMVPISLGTWSASNPRILFNFLKLAVGTTVFCAAAVYLEVKYIRERQAASKEQKDD